MSNPVLSIGDKDAEVGVLHQDLIEQGFDCNGDVATHDFGPVTESVVKLFQACHIGPNGQNLTVDGIVGSATWWALDHPSGSDQHQPITDMPVQAASNPIAAAALASALAELNKDVYEILDGSNRGPEIDLYTGMEGRPNPPIGPPWCAYFVSWNFAKASKGSPFGRIGGAQTIALWCLKHILGSVTDVSTKLHSLPMLETAVLKGIFTGALGDDQPYVPRCGDIGVIANGQVHGHAVHVQAALGETVWTVEGNSGNAVRARKRLVTEFKWFVNFDVYAKSKGIV